MAINDFKPFAIGSGANVTEQPDYEALTALAEGFMSGKASSEQVNKVLRQATVMSSVLAQFISDQLSADVLDNGDTATLLNHLIAALNANGAASFLQKANNLSEIAAAGAAAQVAAIAHLGISANLIPVGIPLPWSTATAPAGWLKCNGSSFSTATYPNLAIAYPSGVLPDLRGEFMRGWDDGRGVDSSRNLLSFQGDAIRNITGKTVASKYGAWLDTPSGAFSSISTSYQESLTTIAATQNLLSSVFDASRVVPTANENRPRNIAFNYIVRAA